MMRLIYTCTLDSKKSYLFSWLCKYIFTACGEINFILLLTKIRQPLIFIFCFVFVDDKENGEMQFTPWFKLISDRFLFKWWDNLDRIKNLKDHKTIHRFS